MKYFLLLALFFYAFSSCQNSTSHEVISKNEVQPDKNSKAYNLHKQILADSMRQLVFRREEAYYPDENDSFTGVIIDTILYSPLKDKFASLVITKNSDDKLLSKGDANSYHYDANCFIGYLKDNRFSGITWLDKMSVTNFADLDRARNRIRKMFFSELKDVQDGYGNSMYGYNINEEGFWTGPFWNGNDPKREIRDTAMK